MKKKILLAVIIAIVFIIAVFGIISIVSTKRIDVSNSKAEEFIQLETTMVEDESNNDENETTDVYETTISAEVPIEPVAEEIWPGYGIKLDDFDVQAVLENDKSNFEGIQTDAEDSVVFAPGTQDNPSVYRRHDNTIYSKEDLADMYDENFDNLYDAVVSYYGDDEAFGVLTEYLNTYVKSSTNGHYIYDYRATPNNAFYLVVMRGKYYYHFAIVKEDNGYALINYATRDYFQSSLTQKYQDEDMDMGEN